MTETQAPEVNAPEQKQETTKVVPPREKLSVLTSALLASAEPKVAEIKALAEKQAKVGDVGQLLSDAIANSDDPKVKELRAKREKAAEAINRFDKDMEALVKPTLSIPTEEELAADDASYKQLASELNTFNQVFSGEIQKEFPGITLFDYVGELPGKRRGAKAGQGQGTSRPRVKSVEVTEDKTGETGYVKVGKEDDKGEFKSTFSFLSQWLKGKTGEVHGASDFHEAWMTQLGIKEWTDAPEVSKFTYSVTDKDNKTHQFWVRVTR